MILVTGATGNAGSAVARALVAAGEDVRALVREGSQGAVPAGAQAVTGDLNSPKSLREPLHGVRAVFLLSGYDRIDDTLSEMQAAGVERVVLLSSSAVPRGDMTNAIARYHILSERAVRDSGLAWTFLQPNSFMTNALRWLPQLRAGDVVRDAWPDVAVASIDPDDIAAVAVLGLTTRDHEGRSYRLSGPESLRPADRVRILGEALGRDLRFEGQSDNEARAQMSAAMPAEYVDAFFSFFSEGKHDETPVLPTVEEVTGRPPGTFREWAIAHRDAFR